MNRILSPASVLAVLGALGVVAACSSSSDEHAPPVSNDGGATSGGQGGAHTAGRSGAGAGGVAKGGESPISDAGDGGSSSGDAGSGGEGGSEPGTIIDVPDGDCSESADWTGPIPLSGVSTNANERLLSITPDELDVVFLRGTALMRGHRNAAADPFGTAAAVTLPTGYDAGAGAALSADGKTLVLIASNGQGFASVSRATRSAAFGTTADTSEFIGLNQRSVQTMEHYAAPVLSPDGKTFVFGAFTPEPAQGFPEGVEGVAYVYESVFSNGAWAMPNNLSEGIFNGTTAARPLPSSLSSDSRTLFYFDEKTSKQAARFRDRPDAPLYTLVDLGDRDGAVVNSACNTIYYTSNGNVLVETK